MKALIRGSWVAYPYIGISGMLRQQSFSPAGDEQDRYTQSLRTAQKKVYMEEPLFSKLVLLDPSTARAGSRCFRIVMVYPSTPAQSRTRQTTEGKKLMSLEPNFVFCAKTPAASYAPCPDVHFPELPVWAQVTTALVALRSLLAQAGLDHSHLGSPNWNPLGAIIHEGAKV